MWKTKTHTFRLYLVLCLVVFFAALLLPACASDEQVEETVEEVDISEQINFFFVPDKILFTGVPADIITTTGLVTKNLGISLEQEWSIDNLRPLQGFDEESLFSIRQYSLSNDQLNVLEIISNIIAEVDKYEAESGVQLAVFPEPVFRIGVRADIIGQGGGNSPGIEGAPGGGSAGIEGAPGGDLGSVPDIFLSQWAFQSESGIGINLNETTGKGVQVFVFDSLPLGADDCFVGTDDYENFFNFCGVNTLGSGASEPDSVSEPGSVNEHGYFVASLVQAIAPESQINLIQVLEPTEDGEGVVGSLGHLLKMMDTYLPASENGETVPVVINLSLGLKLNSIEDGESEAFRSALYTLCTATNNRLPSINKSENAQDPCPSDGPIPSVALQVYIEHVTQKLGHLVIASAGNEWGDSSADQPSALLPAGLAGVIGVGSSNHSGGDSCFSNQGYVKAPGGNGYDGTEFDEPACHVDIVKQCYEGEQSWSDGLHGGCPSAIIGRVFNTSDNYSSGFAYWVGTSFSAPMVSGLAALVWQVNPGLDQCQVGRLIASKANGNGIIDVLETIKEAPGYAVECPD